MAFYSDEYKHLLLAERVLSKSLEAGEGKLSEQSQCARALVDVVQMKRFMRGRGNPKPTEGKVSKPSQRRSAFGPSPAPSDTTPAEPSTPQVLPPPAA